MVTLTRITDLSGVPGPLVLAMGVFDGVHLGHQAVLGRALADASTLGGSAVAITFDPHPAKILRPETAPRLLTSTLHKLSLLATLGVHAALVLPFDQALAATPATDFIQQLLSANPALREIVVGQGWTFGKGRLGTVTLVREAGSSRGFDAVEIPPVQVDGIPVSSTRIRRAVAQGDFAAARSGLGRDFSVQGIVQEGTHRGRSLGFPTANLQPADIQLPPDGVYAVRTSLPGEAGSRPAVANLGVRPTLTDGGLRLLEVHIPGFSGGPLYGATLEITFQRFLRSERKFPSVGALAAQIQNDIQQAVGADRG